MLLTNQYHILCKDNQGKWARAGQFVYRDNLSDEVVGFVSKVLENGQIIEITTFGVMDVSKLPIVWCNHQVVNSMELLLRICEQDAQIREIWKEVASFETYDEEMIN